MFEGEVGKGGHFSLCGMISDDCELLLRKHKQILGLIEYNIDYLGWSMPQTETLVSIFISRNKILSSLEFSNLS